MSDLQLARLGGLIDNCQRQIDMLASDGVDTRMASVETNHTKKSKKDKKSKKSKKGKGVGCYGGNVLYGLKHCLHRINQLTSDLDTKYVHCLVNARTHNDVRDCFDNLRRDILYFHQVMESECNVRKCQMSQITNKDLDCCAAAATGKDLSVCFEKMIQGPLTGSLLDDPTVL
jgi:hypothetical protein